MDYALSTVPQLQEFVKQEIALTVERYIREIVEVRMNETIRVHLDEIIRTAKDEATKQIAAKLLKCALE